MDEQDSPLVPQAAKKTKKGKITAAGAGLEGFVDWVSPNASNPTEEKEDNMSSLATRFATPMSKREVSTHGETTPGFEVSGKKRSRRSDPDEEA